MDADTRRIVADAWADKLGYADDINYLYRIRQNYEDAHPEFAQFRGWQDQMYDLSSHLGGSLAEYRRQASAQNPNAARYFQDMVSYVHETYPEAQWELEIERRTTNAEAWQAITGQSQMRYDPAPQPGIPPGDYTVGQMNPGYVQSGPYNQNYDWMRAIENLPGGYSSRI
jgi:hypothetical protein